MFPEQQGAVVADRNIKTKANMLVIPTAGLPFLNTKYTSAEISSTYLEVYTLKCALPAIAG